MNFNVEARGSDAENEIVRQTKYWIGMLSTLSLYEELSETKGCAQILLLAYLVLIRKATFSKVQSRGLIELIDLNCDYIID